MENKPKSHPNPKLKLMDQMREVCDSTAMHIAFGGKAHPRHLGAKYV